MTTCVIMKFWNEEQLLPLTLGQFADSGIDCLNLFDDGSTDDSFNVAYNIIKDFPFKTSLTKASAPHARYFPDDTHEPESGLLNRMIDSAKGYDWCIQVDADEVICNWWFMPWIHKQTPSTTAIRVPFFHLVDKIDKFIITMPGLSYNLHPDYHVRIFRPNCWRFPDHPGLDAIIRPISPGDKYMKVLTFSGIIHLHYLDANRRGLRNGDESTEDGDKQADFRKPGCTYGTVPDALMPGILTDWYASRKPGW